MAPPERKARGKKAGRGGARPQGRGGRPQARRDGPPPPAASGAERPLREDLVRALVLEAYDAIRGEGRVADRALDALLRRERRLWSRERRAVAETVYDL